MTEQNAQNNYKIIEDLKTFSKNISELSDIKDIELEMSKIRHYISDYKLLNEEFEKKCNSYKNALLSSQGKSYINCLFEAVKTELPDSMFCNTGFYQKYSEPNYFYFPAFLMLCKIEIHKGNGIYNFYELRGPESWSKVLEKTGFKKEIKILMEDFCFYFVNLINIDVKFYEDKFEDYFEEFQKFNLSYIYSIINYVLVYFQELIHKNSTKNYSIKSISLKRAGKIPKTGKALPKNLKEGYLKVLYLLRKGFQKKEIADKIGYSIKTVELYKDKICDILNAKNIAEAVANFIENYGSIEFYVPDDLTQKK